MEGDESSCVMGRYTFGRYSNLERKNECFTLFEKVEKGGFLRVFFFVSFSVICVGPSAILKSGN